MGQWMDEIFNANKNNEIIVLLLLLLLLDIILNF